MTEKKKDIIRKDNTCMAIKYEKEKQLITLETEHSTYQMWVSPYGHLLHLYYGKKAKMDFRYLLTYYDRGFSGNPFDCGEDRTYSLDVLPQEYPCYGNGDFRSAAFEMKNADGVFGCDLRFVDCKIRDEKYSLEKLPAVYAEKAQTLEVILEDEAAGVQVTLLYGVLENLDVITRTANILNKSEQTIYVTKADSMCLDFLNGEYDFIHFHGRHGMERKMERTSVISGSQSVGSRRGTSSHQHSPFVILSDKNATEDNGSCYGISFLYSGNFHCEVEKDQFMQTRISMGIQNDMLEYDLKPGEMFQTPETAISFAEGFAELSHQYHKLIQDHVCRGEYQKKPRPILINNWEATYFDFDGEKIVDIAKKAAELGVEMLVLDDGWFGKRDSDYSGLGDWYVNEEKMKGTLANVVRQINDMGMKFGLWIEPEMVSEDSDLYREHPDWAYIIPGRKPIRGRHQLVLDFSRKEVVEHVFAQIAEVVDAANIEYIKMDMNRSITDIYTATSGFQNQGKIMYEYVLGVYDFLEKMLEHFPHLLIEGCSGGGGRFDAGMLYYTPQIWCSDNTDAIDRIMIQYGTSFGFPISAVGSHVSAVPNHQNGRITSIETRGVVAMAGSFGYELDLNLITDEEKNIVKQQIADCKNYWELTHEGRYYRLTDPTRQREYAAWEFVSEDQKEVLLNVVTLDTHFNSPVQYVFAKGLKEDAVYVDPKNGQSYRGAALMYGGYPLPIVLGEYNSYQIYLIEK